MIDKTCYRCFPKLDLKARTVTFWDTPEHGCSDNPRGERKPITRPLTDEEVETMRFAFQMWREG